MAEREQLVFGSRNPTTSEAFGYGSLSSSTEPEQRRRRLRRPAIETDRCWSVPVAAAFVAFLSFLASSSYGYLYVLFMDVYGVHREEAAWPQTALAIAGGCAGLLVSLLQQKFPVYQITLMGAMMASAGVVASSFAPNIAWLTATFGVIQGVGVGTALLGVATYLMLYFDKYKASAVAIKEIGTVVAGLTGVPITSYFTTMYGVHGCLLLVGGLMMHMLPVVMLIKDPRPSKVCGAEEDRLPTNGVTEVCTENPEEALNASSSDTEVQRTSSSGTSPPAFANSQNSVLPAFVVPAFCVLVLFQVISDYTFTTYATTIVDYIVDKGTALASAKKILVYGAFGQVLGRVVLPFVTDKRAFSRSPVAAACFFAAAVCYVTIPLVSAFGHVVALAWLAGVAEGYILCIKPVLMTDHIGLKRYSFCCGVSGIVGMPVWLSGPTILGLFRDARGSYDNLYFMLSGLNLAVAALLALLAWREIIERRRLPA